MHAVLRRRVLITGFERAYFKPCGATTHQVASPGGDIKLITTDDMGASWSVPSTLLTHEADGGVPKVLANKLCIVPSTGAWVLPFW